MNKHTYRCNDCERTFDEPEFICEREIMDYGIGKTWITLFEGEVCPYCESNDWADIPEPEPEEI